MRSLFVSATLACVILMVGFAFAGTFIPKLQGDTYIDAEDEDESFGMEDTLWATSEDDDPVKVTFISFGQISGKSPDDIESATLEVYVTEVESDGDVSAYFYNEGFFEDMFPWSEEPVYDDEAADTLPIDEEDWYEFDVTDIVKKAVVECQTCPFSIVLEAEEDASIGFASKEYEGDSDDEDSDDGDDSEDEDDSEEDYRPVLTIKTFD